MYEINKRLMEYVHFKSMSKSEFAKSIEVTPSILSHISSGRNKIGTDVIQKIALNHPELNLEWLLTGNGQMTDELNNGLNKELIDKMKRTVSDLKVRISLLERDLKELNG